MRSLLTFLFLLFVTPAFAQGPPATQSAPSPESPTLSACETAEATVIQLRERIVELIRINTALQAQMVEVNVRAESAQLVARRAELEAQFRKTLKPPEGSTFNWKTLVFDPPPQK